MNETHRLPDRLAELLGDIVFRPGRVLQESRRSGAKRIRKVSLPDAPDWQGKFGVYLPVTPSGIPLKVGLGRNSRFTEPWLVDESACSRADTIGTVIYEAPCESIEAARALEAELRERLLRAGYALPYNREPAARRIRAELARSAPTAPLPAGHAPAPEPG